MSTARQQINQSEIDAVLAHHSVGSVHGVRELPEGSLTSPKVILQTDRGTLLLKRRARGLDMPALVAFGHEVLLGCLSQGLCVPPLLGTRDDGNSFVQHADHVYELFVYIPGERFNPANRAHAHAMGALLSETHDAMDRVRTTFPPATEPETINLDRLATLKLLEPLLPPGLREDATRMASYAHELARANATPPALVHGDWHPGNMIFRADELVAVCDFDNTRLGSRDRELAQALIHASMVPPVAGRNGTELPPEPDATRLEAFWQGYRRQGGRADPRTIAGLMPGVMIDEALASIGNTPSEQHASLLAAVWRKAAWMDQHQSQLLERLGV